jgi:hypothetical protein
VPLAAAQHANRDGDEEGGTGKDAHRRKRAVRRIVVHDWP